MKNRAALPSVRVCVGLHLAKQMLTTPTDSLQVASTGLTSSARNKLFSIEAAFHSSRFARAGGANDFNLVKISRARTPRKLNVVQNFQACPRAQKQTENAQIRHV